jgi:hypothetical protein
MRVVASFLVSSSRRGMTHLRSPHALRLANHATTPVLSSSSSRPMNVATFSTTKKPSSGIRGWMEGRRDRKEQENYMDQMNRLSDMEALTLEKYQEELNRGLDSWGAKLSFGLSKEVKMAKDVVECINCFMGVMGKNATADDLIGMDRLQRLKVATSSKKSVEDIQIMISQVQNMDLMQRTLRKRRQDGKPIPPDSQTMQAAIKKDALSVMSKTQKEMMKDRQKDQARRMARKKR